MTNIDCGCLPALHPACERHWQHMDHLLREHNEALIQRLIARGDGAVLLHVMARCEEIARLREKAMWLEMGQG